LAGRDRHALAQDSATRDTAFDVALTEYAGHASGTVLTLVDITAPQRILLVLVKGIVEGSALGGGRQCGSAAQQGGRCGKDEMTKRKTNGDQDEILCDTG